MTYPTIKFDTIVAALEAEGITAYVEQTGGGCATILVGEPFTYEVVLPWNGKTVTEDAFPAEVGPGWFNEEGWTDGEGHATDLSVGPGREDLYDKYGVYFNDENPATVKTVVAAVKRILTAREN